MRVGIVANEFFALELGRIGGFGWAARSLGATLAEAGHGVVFFSGEHDEPRALDGAPLVPQRRRLARYLRAARAHPVDLLVTIDYRANYLPTLLAFPRTPLVVWVRDPVDERKRRLLATLRVPGEPATPPVRDVEYGTLAHVASLSRALRRPLVFANDAPALLEPRARAAYGVPLGEMPFLPNAITIEAPPGVGRGDPPRFVFLARLDPIKRPWLFAELARRIPAAEFLMLGERFAGGPESWRADPPPNLRLLGHVDGEQKAELLASARALVNTSLDEGLPVSFLEALACGTPLVAGVDPEGVVSRFGQFAGSWDGDGTAGLDAFEAALRRLLERPDEAERLGAAGREWVQATHSPDRLLAAFEAICARVGLARALAA